jgi:hypothetical protein
MLIEPAATGPPPSALLAGTEPVETSYGTNAAWRSWRTRYAAALVCADILAAVVAIWACYAFRSKATLHDVAVLGRHVSYSTLALLSVPVWLASLGLAGAYRPGHPTEELWATTLSTVGKSGE